MSVNPLTLKIVAPYVRALFDFSIEKNVMHQIAADFQKLSTVLDKTPELIKYLNNPVVNQKAKGEILDKTLKSQINPETFKFLMVLVKRDRINLLSTVIESYFELLYKTASIKMVEVLTASPLTNGQKTKLIQKLKKLTNSREIKLKITLDPSLIGGFLIKNESKVLDFTVKNQLNKLAKHLDTVLEI